MTTSDYTMTKHETGTREEGMSKVIVIAFALLTGSLRTQMVRRDSGMVVGRFDLVPSQ